MIFTFVARILLLSVFFITKWCYFNFNVNINTPFDNNSRMHQLLMKKFGIAADHFLYSCLLGLLASVTDVSWRAL